MNMRLPMLLLLMNSYQIGGMKLEDASIINKVPSDQCMLPVENKIFVILKNINQQDFRHWLEKVDVEEICANTIQQFLCDRCGLVKDDIKECQLRYINHYNGEPWDVTDDLKITKNQLDTINDSNNFFISEQ